MLLGMLLILSFILETNEKHGGKRRTRRIPSFSFISALFSKAVFCVFVKTLDYGLVGCID